MGSHEAQPMHVIIAGAGVAGLLIAHGLQRACIDYTIFEAESHNVVRRDWGLSLHWAKPLLKDLLPSELYEKLQTTQVHPFYETPEQEVLPIINGKTGEILTKLEFGQNYRISRKRFRELCTSGLNIEFGKRLTGIGTLDSGEVVASFDDGSTARGDVLIGCDGARSKVRDTLFGKGNADVRTLPYEAYFANPRYPAEVALELCKIHPIHTTAIHPDGLFCWLGPLHIPDPEKPETWQFVLAISGPKDKAGFSPNGADSSSSNANSMIPATGEVDRLQLLKGNVARFEEPYKTALALLSDDEPTWYIDLTQWETEPWDNRNGRLTLAGDAAHPMTFHRGQGLNNAILDATNFVKALTSVRQGSKTLSDALAEYDQEVQVRGREEVQSSYKNTQMLLNWDAFQKSPLFTAGLKREKA